MRSRICLAPKRQTGPVTRQGRRTAACASLSNIHNVKERAALPADCSNPPNYMKNVERERPAGPWRPSRERGLYVAQRPGVKRFRRVFCEFCDSGPNAAPAGPACRRLSGRWRSDRSGRSLFEARAPLTAGRAQPKPDLTGPGRGPRLPIRRLTIRRR